MSRRVRRPAAVTDARAHGAPMSSERQLCSYIAAIRTRVSPGLLHAGSFPTLPPMESFAGRRVFVVDDDRDQAESLSKVLQLMGCQVAFVTDARGALEAIADHRPELAFIDLQMPHIDGYQLTQQLRRQHGYDTLRLVALTGSTAEYRVRTRQAGFDAHLAKPIDIDLLRAALLLFLPRK